MRKLTRAILVLVAGSLGGTAAANDISARFHYSDDTLLSMGQYTFDGGRTLDFSVGIGSGAFRHPNDAPDVMWTVGDRGPNIACSEIRKIAGVDLPACRDVANGRVYPRPTYAPSIYRVMLMKDDTFRVTDVITLKDRDGTPLNGLLNPLRTAATEIALNGAGKQLSPDVRGIDAEAVIRLSDGTFWIGDENGPSLAHFSADGRLIVRHVPKGTDQEFLGANYEVLGTLPAILTKRAINRGIESLAVSPDERFLYFIMQNPLANPDTATYRRARNTRLFKIERSSMRVIGEYVYTLDDPMSFRRDPSSNQSDPRISELLAIGEERFLVIERTEQTTKIYEINLAAATDILGARWDELSTVPTLEQTDIAAASINPVSKALKLDSSDFPDMLGKTEGMALPGDGSLALINDDDFGIAGARTQIVVLRGMSLGGIR